MVDAAQLTRWLDQLRKGTLTEQDLQGALDDLKRRGKRRPGAPEAALPPDPQHRRGLAGERHVHRGGRRSAAAARQLR